MTKFYKKFTSCESLTYRSKLYSISRLGKETLCVVFDKFGKSPCTEVYRIETFTEYIRPFLEFDRLSDKVSFRRHDPGIRVSLRT